MVEVQEIKKIRKQKLKIHKSSTEFCSKGEQIYGAEPRGGMEASQFCFVL